MRIRRVHARIFHFHRLVTVHLLKCIFRTKALVRFKICTLPLLLDLDSNLRSTTAPTIFQNRRCGKYIVAVSRHGKNILIIAVYGEALVHSRPLAPGQTQLQFLPHYSRAPHNSWPQGCEPSNTEDVLFIMQSEAPLRTIDKLCKKQPLVQRLNCITLFSPFHNLCNIFS